VESEVSCFGRSETSLLKIKARRSPHASRRYYITHLIKVQLDFPAILTLIVLGVIMFVEPFRNSFDLVALAWTDYLLILFVVALWAGVVMLIWRKKVLFRFLNIKI